MLKSRILKESWSTTRLATPLVASQLMYMAMAFIDMVMIGKLGKTPLAAGGLGANLWNFIMATSTGLIMALSPLVAQLIGGKKDKDIGPLYRQGLWLALCISFLGYQAVVFSSDVLPLFDIKQDVQILSSTYLNAIAWGMPAVCIFFASRYLSEGTGHTRPIMIIQLIAMAANVTGNYMLIYGNWGAPQLGVAGAGWATCIVFYLNAVIMLLYLKLSHWFKPFHLFSAFEKPRLHVISHILRLSIPISVTIIMEFGIFTTVALLMGFFGTNAVAAHQIAINYAGLMYMVPLGISMAITIRVGHASGARDIDEARFRGWIGISLAAVIMCISALVMFIIPEKIVGLYTSDGLVSPIAQQLLFAAALFQISDGLQVSSMGALRGFKDTTFPMVVSIISYWLIGFPCAWFLAFKTDTGPLGLWIGLIIGLSFSAMMLNRRFHSINRE